MADIPVTGLNLAQLAALLAAAGGVPIANVPGQQAQVAAPEQANPLAQLLQTLQNQQVPAQPLPWTGLAQLFQPPPQPVPQQQQQQQQPTKATHQDVELEYRNARSAQLDKTIVLFLRAAQSSNMTRYAILEDMDGNHGHSAEWWKTYYLVFADDIDRAVKAGTVNDDHPNDRPLTNRTKPLNGGSALRPVHFPSIPGPSSSSTARKRKARPASPSPSESTDNDEHVDAPASHRSSGSVRKIARCAEQHVDPASDSDEVRGDAAKALEPMYKLTIPSSLPEHAPLAPTNLVPGGRGYMFTDEDLTYFVATILWQAKTEPNASKRTIVTTLSEQASHHTFGSWEAFWKRAKGPDVLSEGLRMAGVVKQE